MLIAFTVMWADLKSSGNETCPSCVTITQCQCLSWTSPRSFDLTKSLQNKYSGTRRVWERRWGWSVCQVWVASFPPPGPVRHFSALCVSPWLCTCVLLTAQAQTRVPCRRSPVRRLATLHHTTGHTRTGGQFYTETSESENSQISHQLKV